MYVAATRAAFWLGCSGFWWGDGASRLGPSPFLTEARAACEAGAGHVAAWAPPPEPDAENPALAEPPAAQWPATPAGQRYEAACEAAAMVTAELHDGHVPGGARRHDAGLAALDPADRELVAAWRRDADLLLTERERRRAEGGLRVTLPGHLSVSALVTLARDPAELARQVRRPMPRPPAPYARRGTAFHRWLEERFGQQRLIDAEDLFGPGDDLDAATGMDADLAGLRERFEASRWGGRWPREVEVPFETLIGDRLVRGRIDAVFGDAGDGTFDVVDWKTGQPPASAAELAAYRLAWAALAGVPVQQVRAAFHYVRHDRTVRPADLLDEAGLAAVIEAVPVGA